MTSVVTPSTPSPSRDLPSPPPAPRFGGYHDNWEPYGARKSARISSQRAANRTPSPRPSQRVSSSTSKPLNKETHRDDVAMVSPAASPRKKRPSTADSSRRVSGGLTAEGTSNAAAALGFKTRPAGKSGSSAASRAQGMLPTPSKTPKKPPTARAAAEIDGFAKNLFPTDQTDVAGSSKRRPKKYSGFTLDSFTAEDEDNSVEIFIDSQERVPEKDNSTENPFYGDTNASAESSSNRRTRRKPQVHIPGEGFVSIEEAARRDDGIIMNFRGKKFFRKYSENDDSHTGEQDSADAADVESRLVQPMTRSTVKPRLLFPSERTEQMIEDEEAATDVEDVFMDEEETGPQTPAKSHHTPIKTPNAPKFANVSPPDTKRVTRSTNKLVAGVSSSSSSSGRASPFDLWKRTKDASNGSAVKRRPESVADSQAKRARI